MKKQSLYRRALSHAFDLTRNHKTLWIFGLFAAMLGQMGFLEFFKRIHLFGYSESIIPLYFSWIPAIKNVQWSNVHISMVPEGFIWLLWLVIIILALMAMLVFAAVSSHGALIAAAAQSTLRAKLPNSETAWHVGVYHFWRLLGVHIFRVLVFIGVGCSIMWAMYNALVEPTAQDLLLYIFTTVLALTIGLVVAVWSIYTAGYIVVEDYGFIPSVRAGWRLFTDHWLVSVEVGFIMALCNIAAICLTFFGALLFFFPAVLLWLVAIATGNAAMYVAGFLLAVVLFVGFLTLLAAAFTVFSTSVWTTLFMAMHKQGVKSRILMWMR